MTILVTLCFSCYRFSVLGRPDSDNCRRIPDLLLITLDLVCTLIIRSNSATLSYYLLYKNGIKRTLTTLLNWAYHIHLASPEALSTPLFNIRCKCFLTLWLYKYKKYYRNNNNTISCFFYTYQREDFFLYLSETIFDLRRFTWVKALLRFDIRRAGRVLGRYVSLFLKGVPP